MKIDNLILYKYRRMSNLPYDKFTFKPKSKINIILGSNGMGKSSLLKELLPNAEDTKKEYLEDGYKILNFEHNNRNYTISYRRDENKYSFIVDDNELNPSYNMKTFKRLIEEHFNLSKDVFYLLTGNNDFTVMSTSERKKWFTEILSDTDYEYGLVIYNKARARYRELTGMLKMIESKLLKEYEELKNSELDVNKIKNEISYLESIKRSLTNNISKPDNLPNVYDRLKNTITDYNSIKVDIDNEIDDKIINVKSTIDNIKNNIEHINKQIEQYTKMLTNNNKIIELEKELSNIKDIKVNDELNIDEWITLYNTITDNYTDIVDIDSEIKTLNSKHPIDDLDTLNIKLNDYINNKDKIDKEIKILEYKLNELDRVKEDKIECPKCGHIWSPKFNETLYNNLTVKYNELNKTIIKLNKDIEILKADIDILNKRKDIMWKLNTILKSNNVIFKYVKNKIEGMSKDEKLNIISSIILDTYVYLKSNIEDIKRLKRKDEIVKQLKWYKEMSSIDKNKINEMLNDISNKKIEYIDKLDKYNSEYNKLKNIKNKIDKKLYYKNEIVELLNKIHKYKINKYKELKYRYDLNILKEIEDMILILKDKSTSIEIRKNKIKELEDDKKELIEKRKATSKIIEALSPSKGLLAKGLVEFVNNIIEDMNVVISNIFDYDLSIKPIDLENGKLDFNFKLISKGNEIADISKGSSGMREVIDLAFKLVSMRILGMEDYPLILDEFGRALDSVHRSNAYDYINEISNEMFSQIFIVTHNEDVFSRFPNANIVLLDKEHYNILNSQ